MIQKGAKRSGLKRSKVRATKTRYSKTRYSSKGRIVDRADQEAVANLLAERQRERSMLIEYLHLIQDAEGCLPVGHMQALAGELRISMAEVYEVATFYAHFDIVGDGDERPAGVTIRVCESLSCKLAGAEALSLALENEALDGVRIVRAPCMGACDLAPACEVGHRAVGHATVETVRTLASCGKVEPEFPDYEDLDAYETAGGYKILRACLSGALSVDEVVAILSDGGLRGLGGAGFPTGRKWDLVRNERGPRLMAVNGDEGEPGTFKDRHYLETRPHRILEGMLIGAWAIEAREVFIYIRDEYSAALQILKTEIAKIEVEDLTPHTKVTVRRGAGAYICGEESAMIESIEGKRGLPRHRPPYVAQVGIFGRPTLVNNIETLYWIPEILEKGPEWFADHGINGAKGLRSYSVSGRVKNPGAKVMPAGSTAHDLIAASGGMVEGHDFKAYLPGGASGGILPASMADIPLDFGKLEEHGCFVGSHAVIILSHRDNMKDVVLNLMEFFAAESCGQCTPCRLGCEKSVKLLEQPTWDEGVLRELAQVMADASICGLGQAAPNPLLSVMKYFREELK